jgi:hypothetical protein
MTKTKAGAIVRGGSGRQRTNPESPARPKPPVYTYRGDALRLRKGSRCQQLKLCGSMVQVRFQDGFVAIVPSNTLRRVRDSEALCSPSSSSCLSPTSSFP